MAKQLKQKNYWYGLGRQHIEIPKAILKSRVQNNTLMSPLFVSSLGYYPKAKGHMTYRKSNLAENILFYCEDGSGWCKIEDKKFVINPNEFFMLPQNLEHSYGSDPENPWSVYWMHIGGEALPYFNKLHAVQKYGKPFHIKNNGDILSVYSKMYKALELGYSTDNLIFVNMTLYHFLTLFIYNARHYPVNNTEKTDCVDTAILHMKTHINENISLEELSRLSNYSSSRFCSLFKQKTGYAPIDYFIQMKMQKASQELDFTDRHIKDIALSMGFDDPYYFSKRFRKAIGLSPQKYRQMRKPPGGN
ncbi:MAG: AraC family transcriptional regulator [Ferruginibacter sp.]